MKSRIYTRTGDDGTTALLDGTRVSKASARVDAYGTVDEANAFIGAARAFANDELLDEVLGFVEHRFYNCSSIVAAPHGAGPSGVSMREEDVQFLEQAIDETVLGRLATPRDCADAVVFLCSGAARHITGEVLKVDGGQYI